MIPAGTARVRIFPGSSNLQSLRMRIGRFEYLKTKEVE
jgi:hypothetical protein